MASYRVYRRACRQRPTADRLLYEPNQLRYFNDPLLCMQPHEPEKRQYPDIVGPHRLPFMLIKRPNPSLEPSFHLHDILYRTVRMKNINILRRLRLTLLIRQSLATNLHEILFLRQKLAQSSPKNAHT